MKKIKIHWIYKAALLCVGDAVVLACSYFAALFLRFDFRVESIPRAYMAGYLWSMPFWIVSTVVIFYIFRLYHSIWSFVSIMELKKITLAELVLIPVYIVGAWFMELHMPKSYYFMGYVLKMCIRDRIAVVMICFAIVLARWQTERLIRPINELDLNEPLKNNIYEELQPLLESIDKQNKEKDAVAQMRKEFSANVSHELKTPLTLSLIHI